MNHIRFLGTFVFFLCCFLVTGAIAYYLSAEISRVEEMTQSVGSASAQERARQREFVQTTQGLVNRTVTTTDPVVAQNMPGGGENHVSNLRELSAYLGSVEARYRRIAAVKAQQPMLLLGDSALDLNTQVSEARDEVATLQSALNELRDGGEVQVSRELLTAASTIYDELAAIQNVPAEHRVTLQGYLQISQGFARAKEEARMILDTLSFSREDDRFELVALASSSPAARSASRLLMLLRTNSLEGLRRPLDQALVFDGHPSRDIEMRALIADLKATTRRYQLDPSYAAGVTIEEIVYHQDLLLDMLHRINLSLADQLAVTLAVRHRDAHTTYQQSALDTIERMQTSIEGIIRDHLRTFGTLDSQASSTASRIDDHKAEIEEFYDRRQHTAFADAVIALEMLANQLEQDIQQLRTEFRRLRTEGIPRPTTPLTHAADDGRIALIDDASSYLHIDLGRADNVRRGMRFMVMGERGGEPYAKAMIEVVNILSDNYSSCRLLRRFDDSPIFEGDPIFNRFYSGGRFLRVALVGEFRPDVSPLTEERLTRFLQEIGCDVQTEADVNTDLVILAEPREDLMPVLPEIRRYLELTELITLDEVLVTEVHPYFEDR